MHARIYQLNTERLPKEDWINEYTFEPDHLNQFLVDYVNDNREEHRNEDLKWLKELLPETTFKMEGDEITIIGDGRESFYEWRLKAFSLLNNMNYDSWARNDSYKLLNMGRKIIDTDHLFYIEDWSGLGWVNTLFEVAKYAHEDMLKSGSEEYPKLYVNGILDFHY